MSMAPSRGFVKLNASSPTVHAKGPVFVPARSAGAYPLGFMNSWKSG